MRKRQIHNGDCGCKLCGLHRQALKEIDKATEEELPSDGELSKMADTGKFRLLRSTRRLV